MRIKNYRKRSIGTLVVLLFVLSFSISPALLFNDLNFGPGPIDEVQNIDDLNLSTNYLFKGTSYIFNLDDFYDDANLYKVWTGAKFQTEAENETTREWSGTVNNDTVTPVDNDETQYGDPSNVNMIDGSYDYTDNMKVNDDSSTNFTSTHTDGYLQESPHQWDNFTFTEGSPGATGELETDDGDSARIDASGSSSEQSFDILLPDNDVTTGWNEGDATPHWSKLDEAPVDMDGDGGNIIETGLFMNAIYDEQTYDDTALGTDNAIRIRIHFYAKKTGNSYLNIRCSLIGWEMFDAKTDTLTLDYAWSYVDWTGSWSDAQIDGITIRYYAFTSPITPTGVVDLEASYIEIFKMTDVYLVDFEMYWNVTDSNLTTDTIDYFTYDYRTTIAIDCDLDIYNWDTTGWLELESNTDVNWHTDSYTLTDPYIQNETNIVKVRFQSATGSDFDLNLDQIALDYLTTPAELEMTITFPFANYNEDLLAMTVQSWQKTNISQTINFSIWNYDTETWVQISSSSDTTFTKKEYNTTSPTDFISPTGVVKLNWTGINITNDFELHIDYLFIQIYYKLDLVHSKSFDTNGIYRYRWVVLGSIHYTDWVVFEVVDPEPNFHAISESDNPTRWLLQGAEITGIENFTDDIDPSSAWDLYDVSPIDFNIYIPELDNYLTDYITLYGSSYESPAQWGDFSFTKGAGNTVGELETDNDANYAIVDAGYTLSGESLLGTIKPADPDITTDWYGDLPHWSRLDEGVGGAPDGLFILSGDNTEHDKWNFDTLAIPAGRVVTKLVFYGYCDTVIGAQPTIHITTSVGASGSWLVPFNYAWEDDTVTGLDFGQAELDDFWMDIYITYGVPTSTFLEAVYVEVYTSLKQYSADYIITWDVDDLESIENFSYDYRTTFAVDCDLDIHNWDTYGWLELESNTDVNWHTDNYTLTDPYISGSNEIKIRFQSALTTTNFDMELDQIAIVYNSIYTISKKHNDTIPGYAYMQTNTTELISLNSSVYGTNYTLNSGDYFEVDFQTSSDSQINLILLRDGVVNKTLILSQSGNPNFNRHIVQVSVDETVEFDQLRFSSTFEDTDYIKIHDIKTYKYEITGDTADFYVGSHQDYELYLTPDFYNLRIHDPYDGEVKVNTNITISSGYNFHIYQPVKSILCRITLFSPEGDYLQFEDYHIKINRSLSGGYNQFDLVDTLFYADEETYVYIEVYDRFDASINNFSRLASSYIDLEIEVYSLQIKNLQTQKTTVDINTTHVYPLLSEESIYFMLAKNYYQIGYYDTNNVYKQFLIYLDSNQAYELNRSKICFLAYVNQKGEHLYFDDYKTYINDSLIYENVFYREIGDDIGIEVKDLYGISIKNQSYTVVSGDNYIPVVLTMYSLKVMNQQEQFNHINITRDPNYYESGYYWSEWIAPNEIIKFRLFPGYYKINLTDNENGAYSNYAYTLNGDDILLISSDNIISQVIYNIENVNTTIGNLITNVEINITNQNSAINNSIVNVEINLGNINSTLGNMLVNLDVDITNIANNISTLYVFTNNSFINLNNVMNTSFIYMENNIISINQSISNLVIGISNDIYLINGTISTMISQLETNLLLMNVSIDTALFDLGTTLDLIGSNITNNYILLNNSITLTNTNINDSRIAIINNLLLVNNTISTLVSEVYSAVYLINNSIYTAVVDLGTYLSLMNNTIYGNLSIVLQMNDFLTELYQMTMFSDLLNWTDIGLNTSLLTSQIDAWTFVNNYINQSVEVHLRYQDLIEKLVISADDSIEQYLPNKDVEYNLWSILDGEYLDEWEELDPKNKTVSFGFYEEEIPFDPEPIRNSFNNALILIIFGVGIFLILVGIVLYIQKKNRELQERDKYFNRKLDPTSFSRSMTD